MDLKTSKEDKHTDETKWYLTPGFSILVRWFLVLVLLGYIIPLIGFLLIKGANGHIEQSAQLGDTFGGLMGPFIAFIAAFLTFIAFYMQYQANEQQRKDIKRERFETQLFEIIRLHRENVAEMKIMGKERVTENKKAFVSMYHEFVYIYWICKQVYKNLLNKSSIEALGSSDYETEEALLNLAFVFFFNGVGPNSDEISKYLKKVPDELYTECIKELSDLRESHATASYTSKKIVEQKERELKVKYKPVGGHMSRLGHYYRNMYLAVKYVDHQTFLSDEDKYGYVKILRAQLSNHEQALLYYNVISNFGWRWIQEDKNYLIKYRIIHNVPPPLVGVGIEPRAHKTIRKQIEQWEKDHNKDYSPDLNNWVPFFEWEE